MEIGIIFWILFAVLVGVFWKSKGRDFLFGFVVSLLLSPLIGFIIGLVLKPDTAILEKDQVKSGTMKKCPYCAEIIKVEAIVCRYCGKDLPAQTNNKKKLRIVKGVRGKPHCPVCKILLESENVTECPKCHASLIIDK